MGSTPAAKTKYTSVKRWEEKDRLHMASQGEGRASVSLRKGGLEKACWGGAEGNVESLGSAAIWDRDGNNVWVWGSAQGSREESVVGGVR